MSTGVSDNRVAAALALLKPLVATEPTDPATGGRAVSDGESTSVP